MFEEYYQVGNPERDENERPRPRSLRSSAASPNCSAASSSCARSPEGALVSNSPSRSPRMRRSPTSQSLRQRKPKRRASLVAGSSWSSTTSRRSGRRPQACSRAGVSTSSRRSFRRRSRQRAFLSRLPCAAQSHYLRLIACAGRRTVLAQSKRLRSELQPIHPRHADHGGHGLPGPLGGSAGERPSYLPSKPVSNSKLRAAIVNLVGSAQGGEGVRLGIQAVQMQAGHRRPAAAACVRLTTFSARKIAVTWVFTVFSDRSRSRAIVLFDWPSRSPA